MTPVPNDSSAAPARQQRVDRRAAATPPEPVDLDAIRAALAYASGGIEHAEAPYHPDALMAMKCARQLLTEVERLRADVHRLENSEALRIAALEAELERARPVVEAAVAWAANVHAWGPPLRKMPGGIAGAAELLAAVDTYRTGGGE